MVENHTNSIYDWVNKVSWCNKVKTACNHNIKASTTKIKGANKEPNLGLSLQACLVFRSRFRSWFDNTLPDTTTQYETHHHSTPHITARYHNTPQVSTTHYTSPQYTTYHHNMLPHSSPQNTTSNTKRNHTTRHHTSPRRSYTWTSPQ